MTTVNNTTRTSVHYIYANARLGYFGTKRYYYSVTLKSLVTDVMGNGTRTFTPVDSDKAASFQVGDNYGNCFFMSRKAGNEVFKALKNGTIKRDLCASDLWAAIRDFLVDNGFTYTVGCSQP